MNFEEQFPSLKGKYIRNNPREKIPVKTPFHSLIFGQNVIQKNCLDKEIVKEALSKYSKLNNRIVKSFQSMEEAQELNDAWNTMIDELGIK